MGLANLSFPEAVIKTTGGDFTVRGLNLDSVILLVRKHGEALDELFRHFAASVVANEFANPDFAAIGGEIAHKAPMLAADVIANGAGEPGMVEVARQLPFPIQIEALEKIGTLTFAMEGGPKKMLETVLRVAQGTRGLLTSLPPSLNSSGS